MFSITKFNLIGNTTKLDIAERVAALKVDLETDKTVAMEMAGSVETLLTSVLKISKAVDMDTRARNKHHQSVVRFFLSFLELLKPENCQSLR